MSYSCWFLAPTFVLAIAVCLRVGFEDILLLVVSAATMLAGVVYLWIGASDLKSISIFIDSLAEGVHGQLPKINEVSGVSGIVEAISRLCIKWQRQQLVLRYLAAEMEMFFDIMPEALVVVDREGQIIKANASSQTLFGHNVLHKDVFALVGSDTFELFLRRIIKSENDSATVEIDKYDTRGLVYMVTIRSLARIDGYQGMSALIVFRDITEQKLRDRINADFIANASHEMRTPLTTIFGFVETMRAEKLDDDTRKEFLDIISSQCVRIRDLLVDMEKLYALDVHSPRVSCVVGIGKILSDTMRNFKVESKRRNIGISLISKVTDENAFVVGDHSDVSSVISNLMSNAIKYSYHNSELRIIVDEITYSNGRFIRIKVIDQSPGIHQQDISRLTERFYRVDKSHSSDIPGTGLGLAIVKSIMERYSGRLLISSLLGQGSEFIVLWPMS